MGASPAVTKPLTLGTSVALLIGGGVETARSDGTTGTALLAAGLIVLGAWLAQEVRKDRRDDS